jgi:hypothetical protein
MSDQQIEEGVSEDTGAVDTTPDPLAEQFASLNQRFDEIQNRLPEPQPEPTGPSDLYGSLSGADGDTNFEGISDEEVDAILNEQGGLDEDGDLEVAAFDKFVSERVQAGIEEAMTPYREAQTAKELNALQEKYPDITEPAVFEPVRDFLADLVQRHRNEALATDPAMVEVAYKAVKAEAAGAAEVPAESAAMGEATLETGAGPSHQGEPDPGDEYRKAIQSMSTGSGAF